MRASASEAGYNMVVLIMAVTVLNILVAAMLPLASTAIRREKEEELIFRGFQYAEAIRVFHLRYQRYPNKLEELIEVKPRSIRQLWKDPMTEDGKWQPIFQGEGQRIPLQPQEGPSPPPDQDGQPDGDDPDGRPQFGPQKGDVVQVGPIVGVRSKSGEESFLVFFGKERYDEWHFREDMLIGGRVQSGGAAVPTGSFKLSTRWLGRPMRFLDQPPGAQPQDGTLPDGRRRQRKDRGPNPNLP